MIRRLLIGPILTGVGYATGAYYGADAEQVVNKSPATVEAAIEQLVTDRDSGTFQPEGGKPVNYDLKLEKNADGALTVRMTMNGQEGVVTHIQLSPQDHGQATLVAVQVHADHAVLRDELAGSSKAKLSWAPDWMLNLTARPILKKFAEQIEAGQVLGGPMQGFQSQADWQSSSPSDASRPTTDPNADAERYLAGGAATN